MTNPIQYSLIQYDDQGNAIQSQVATRDLDIAAFEAARAALIGERQAWLERTHQPEQILAADAA
jgi:hypothetical protein